MVHNISPALVENAKEGAALKTSADQVALSGFVPTNTSLGKESFLVLLVTQLQFQDPLSPQDPEEFVAQLAQFSSLEQLVNTNKNLEMLTELQYLTKMDLEYVQALSLLGKTVKVKDNHLMVTDGKVTGGDFSLEKEAKEVSVEISDENGKVIRKLTLGALSKGDHTLKWDGKDDQGKPVADGTYTFNITATDADGQKVKVDSYFTGKVTGIQRENAIVKVLIGDRQVSLDEIVAVMEES